ncbi:MAG: hypothetical protein ACT4OK_15490 [Gemmobacter sp.]
MADNRQVLRLAALRRHEGLAFMAALAPHLAAALAADLRCGVAADGGVTLFLPHWNAPPHRPEAQVRKLRDDIATALHAATGEARDLSKIGAVSRDMAGTLDAAAAAMAVLLLAAEPVEEGHATQAHKLAVIAGAPDKVARLVAATVQRSRHAALVAGTDGAEVLAVVRLSDLSEDGATVDGLRAGLGATENGLTLLAPVETPVGTLYLPAGRTLGAEGRGRAGEVLRGLVAAGRLAADNDLLLFGGVTAYALPRDTPLVPAEELVPAEATGDWLAMRMLDVRPSQAAAEALAAQIIDRRFPVGYRIALHPLPDRMRADADVEALREEIDEREAEIALIRALAAPQLRLLRFTDAQLPALVDGLRRMPPAMQRDAGLTFATAHAAGRPGPAHFVMYDPARVAVEGHLPEYYWRGETEDRPICYWVDPPSAAAMTGAVGEPLIFVPLRSHIVPPVASFGGRLDQTMRLVLGNLFADAAPVLQDEGARPVFVFSPPQEPGFEMEVELLDAARFAPLHLQLRWINDHMLVRSPRLADPALLTRLAEDLYEGEAAHTLADRAGADVAALAGAWAEGAADLAGRIGILMDELADEIGHSHDRIRRAHAYLAAAKTRIEEVDTVVAETRAVLADAEQAARRVERVAEDQAAARLDFVADVLAEISTGERTLAGAQTRIEGHRAAIDRLLDELRLR